MVVYINIRLLILVSCIILQGCQSSSIIQDLNQDPVAIQSYDLPVRLSPEIKALHFRQYQGEKVVFWSVLSNISSQPSENIIIQIVSRFPQEMPPKPLNFSFPLSLGSKAINNLGAYETWTKLSTEGDSCLVTRQYAKESLYWISLFSHYCLPESEIIPSWINGDMFKHINQKRE